MFCFTFVSLKVSIVERRIETAGVKAEVINSDSDQLLWSFPDWGSFKNKMISFKKQTKL